MSVQEPVLSPMVFDKKQDINVLTSEQLDKASAILKAIAHPMRIAILNQLDGGKELSVTEIHESLGIEQSAASHHLGILKDKGVLSSRRDGKNTYYFIRHQNLLGIIDCISKCACF
ncbi:MAG: metalloregulator ArsR/SmtB family transcription factor [Bacteroidales bacterium]